MINQSKREELQALIEEARNRNDGDHNPQSFEYRVAKALEDSLTDHNTN